MSRKTQIMLAIAGVAAGALLALWLRWPRNAPEPGPEEPPVGVATETPAQRQPRDRYVDERYGFVIPAPTGWHNEASGKLRRDFPDARGLIVKSDSPDRCFAEVRVLENPPEGAPDAAKFLAGAKFAFGSAPGQKVLAEGTRTIAGKPGAVLTVSTPGIKSANTVRYAWVFGDTGQVHLRLRNLLVDESQAQTAFDQMLEGFTWTTPATPGP